MNNYVPCQGKGIITKNESTLNIIDFSRFDCQVTVKIVTCHLFENTLFRHSSKLIEKIRNNSVFTTVELFPLKRWQLSETSESWQLFQWKYRNFLATASHRTRPFLKLLRSTSRRFLRRLKAESLNNCPRNSAERSPGFWVLCLN